MASADNEKYLRIVLLLTKGGILVVREVFARELASYISQQGGNLDSLLQNYESNIKKRHYLSRAQCLKLFPPTGKTSFQQWDIGLLVFVTLYVFGTSLSPKEKLEIRQIQILRNDLAHSPNAELDASSYQDYLLILENAIRTLSSGLGSTNLKTRIEQLFNDCKSGSLDIKSTLEHLNEIKEKEELFQKVLDKFKTIEERSKRNTEKIISRVNEVGAELKDDISQNKHMIAELQRKLETIIQKDGLCTKIIQLIGTKIRVEGTDEEVTTLIEEIVIDVINEAEKKTFGSKDIRAIKEAVKQILSDMKCDGDNDVLYAKQSCVFIWVRCNTYKGLRDLLEYIRGPLFSQRLEKLSEAVMIDLNIPCNFTCTVTPSSLRSLKKQFNSKQDDEKGSTTKYKSSIIVPIRCKTIHGLSRILELVEGGEAQHFEGLSQFISNLVGKQVSVTASVDLQEFSEVVQNIDTFDTEVNELFTDLRNMKSMMTVATSLSVDSGVPTSEHWGQELWSHDAGDESEISYLFDKGFKTTFIDEPDIWSESVWTDTDSDCNQSEEYKRTVEQQILQGNGLKIPQLLLPNLPLRFFHFVRKTPNHMDLSSYLFEAYDKMDIDMLWKSHSKLSRAFESKYKTSGVRLVSRSKVFSFPSTENIDVDIVFQVPIQFDECIDTYHIHYNEIKAAGYAFVSPPWIWEFQHYSHETYGPAVLKRGLLCIELCAHWPAYARERLLQRNRSFSDETKLHLMQDKCTLEQVQSEYSPFLWRFTFKLQERYLIEHLNDLQWKCLLAMDILLNDHAVLTNEVFCMTLFYTIEMLQTKQME